MRSGKFEIELTSMYSSIYFLIQEDKIKVCSEVNKHFDKKVGDNMYSVETFDALGLCFIIPRYNPLIWLPKIPSSPSEFGTMAHEIFHAVNHVLRGRGILMSDTNSEECYCMTIGYVTQEAYKKIIRMSKAAK